MSYKISVDTGGTFTDVVVADEAGRQALGKSLTTHDRIYEGIRNALVHAAGDFGLSAETVLSATNMVI